MKLAMPARGGELDQIADVGPLSRVAAASIPVVAPWLPLVVAAFAAIATGLVASPERRATTALFLLLTVAVAIPAWRTPVGGRFGWLVPSVVRAIEYGLVVRIVAVVAPDAMPAAFALLCAIAYHHYDTVYRWRYQKTGPQESVFRIGLGWDGRLVLLAMLLLATDDLRWPLFVAAIALGALFVAESAAGWRRWLRDPFTRSA
ncbi:MAG: DUF5941 domain-containing protein [Sporichthyaceae bacterium]